MIFFSIKWPDCTPDSKKSCDRENRSILQKISWDYQNFSKWNSKFWITVYKGRPQEDEVFGLPGGNYPKEMGHQSRNLFQYGSGIKHSKKFSSLKDDIHSTSSSSKPTVVTDLGMYNWWFTFFFGVSTVQCCFSYWLRVHNGREKTQPQLKIGFSHYT